MTPQEAIVQAAKEAGENPAYALAVAERESAFKPTAHSSKTIHGLYQMRGDLRQKYGIGDSNDPLDQARGWMRSLPDIRSDMKSVLGRDPTDQEAYLGHHFGAKRAARTLRMDPSVTTDAIFTPQEMAVNPHFARAGTIGKLNASVMGDIEKRTARFGGAASPPAPAEPATTLPSPRKAEASNDLDNMSLSRSTASAAPDLSSFGEPVDTASRVPDLSSFGTPV